MKKDIKKLHPYQIKGIKYILTTKKCGLYLGMGLGKTVIALTAIKQLLTQKLIRKILIIAPLRVANKVWHTEIQDWEHLNNLKWSIVTGSENKRMKALKLDADIYIINRENVKWLSGGGTATEYD